MAKQTMIRLILYAVALGMGVVNLVTAVLGNIELKTAIILLSIGLFCLGLAGLDTIKKK